jgi:hypothetical protein
MTDRLIETPAARRQLLAAISAAPAGEKLSIPKLRDALLCQADVLDALHTMVGEGKLDRATLRPPVKEPKPERSPASGKGHFPGDEPAPPVFDALKAEGGRRGLSLEKVSTAVFGNRARIFALQTGTVRQVTADKVRAWIAAAPTEPPAAAPPAAAEPEPLPSVPPQAVVPRAFTPSPGPLPTGAELLSEIIAFCERTGTSISTFGTQAVHDPGLANRLRSGSNPTERTVARVRGFIATAKTVVAVNRKALADKLQSNAKRRGLRAAAQKRVDAGLSAGSAPPGHLRSAQLDLEREQAEHARLADPVERAKVALQRKGRTVYAASVVGGPANRFVVSGMGRDVTPAALLAEAERVTGESFRRAG